MNRRTVAATTLACLLACVAVRTARAQTPELAPTPGPGEGGSGKSIGGNIPFPAGSVEDEKPPPTPWYSVNAQATVVTQGTIPFRSPYVGQSSFLPAYELRTTAT